MKGNRGIFIKLNYKNIGELNSFIYDITNGTSKEYNKYVMCAGKYDKNGWTIVFKAKDIHEAEEIASINSRRKNKTMNNAIIDNQKVSIPSFM